MPNLPASAEAVGQVAPDFTLRPTADQSVCLAQLRGHPVALVFYPVRSVSMARPTPKP